MSPSDEPTISQLFDLTGRVALVTGATGYLGKAMSRALAEAGAAVVACSRNAKRGAELAASLPTASGATHLGIALDQMQPDSVTSVFDAALQSMSQIDILVNNAHEPLARDWTNVEEAEFTRQLTNATAYFQLARLVRNHAVERHAPASIILLGSMYGVCGSYPDAYRGISPASPAAYHTLKGGIIQMTRHLAVYWAADRVRVNCLSPGPFPDPERAPHELVDRLKEKSPSRRMGLPHELKGAVVFLASDASSYMTGQNLLIDGGWTAW
jgi:gluconate 5-dehydrogenase